MITGKKIQKIRKEIPQDSLVKKKRGKRCAVRTCFEAIPYSPKYIYPHDFYLFHGDVAMSLKEGKFEYEFSMLNNFKIIQNINIDSSPSKAVHISLGKNKFFYMPHWSYEIEKLEQTEELEVQGWANKLKDYCNIFEEKMKGFDEMKNSSQPEKIEKLKEIDQFSQEKKKKLVEKYPSIVCKQTPHQYNLELTSVTVNEKWYKDMGFDKDSFVSTVLEEGLPQLSNIKSNCGLQFLELGLNNLFGLGKEGFESAIYDSTLMMKSGYVRNIKAQIHILMTYEKGEIAIEKVVTIHDIDEPKYQNDLQLTKQLNPEFLEKMIQKEQDMNYLVSNYYDENVPLRYTNYDKVCGIKEINN